MHQPGKKVLRRMASNSFMTPVRRFAIRAFERTSNMQLIAAALDDDPGLSDLIRSVSLDRDMLISNAEGAQIYRTVRALAAVPGDLAEVGVYRGASSRIIREAEPSKPFHLFDTFEGLPRPSGKDEAFYEGSYKSSIEDVKNYLKAYRNLHFYKGMFPETAAPVSDCRFSFVHLDVDLYESTLSCLTFFWPRLVAGGALISHDYSTSPGVLRAFQEFFLGKGVGVFPLAHTQCMVVKAGN
jgi:O-methyltransferase